MGEHPKSKQEVSWSIIGRQLVVVIILTVVALVVAFAATMMRGERAAFTSAEVQFTDASPSGLSIVPASCPSNPHYRGQCSEPLPPPPSSGCVIYANPLSITAGQSSTLSWATFSGAGTTGRTITPGIGSVEAQGTITVTPSQTTTYTYSGTYLPFLPSPSSGGRLQGGRSSGPYSCSTTVTVNACPVGYTLQQQSGGGSGQCVFTGCPSSYVPQSGQCVLVSGGGSCTPSYSCQGSDLYYQTSQCSNQFIQTCAYGCSGGACLGVPSPSIVDWSVRPLLVQRDTSVWVSWQAQNVQSCTVRGTNGDGSGSNATGLWNTTMSSGATTTSPITSQTVYTITCQGFAGASPSTVTRSMTVNIAPTFNDP